MEHSPLSVTTGELIVGGLVAAICAVVFLAVAVASYRRGRCLSRYPIWHSAIIAVLAGLFPAFWLIGSLVNRDRLQLDWQRYHADHEARRLTPSR
ncbi:hypothetical protein [Aeromicrobium sp. P5_D10]